MHKEVLIPVQIMLKFYLGSLFLTWVKMAAIHVSDFQGGSTKIFFVISFEHIMPNFNKTMIYHF